MTLNKAIEQVQAGKTAVRGNVKVYVGDGDTSTLGVVVSHRMPQSTIEVFKPTQEEIEAKDWTTE